MPRRTLSWPPKATVGLISVAMLLSALALFPQPSQAQTTSDDYELDPAGLVGFLPIDDETPSTLIYGGIDVDNPGWVVALFDGGSYICSGSLIRDRVVLTAAHCVDRPGDYSVMVGGSYLTAGGSSRNVDKVTVHPDFDFKFGDTDLALLGLNRAVTNSPTISLNETKTWPSLRQPLVAYGWGKYYNSSEPSDRLQGALLFATSSPDGSIDPVYCDLPGSERSNNFCIGGPVAAETCAGDSGGPIAWYPTPTADSGAATLYGLVSYGDTYCGITIWDNKAQTIGTYISWIDENADRLNSGTFIDDDDSIHEANIEWLAASSITKGCNPPINDRFCPKASVTRGQMAAFIRRALSLPFSSTDYFVDDDDSVFEGDINAVAEAGITKGCNPPANDKFCPDKTVSREQMAAFLRRSFDYPASETDYFTDDDGSIFEADINAIAQVGVTKGCNPPANDRFCPTNKVTREQMASFLRRTLE